LLLLDSGPNDVFIVYGVNHAATGHSEYASITAYRYSKLSGLVSKSSEDGYLGSANMYLPGGAKHRSSPYLFAYAFARDCSSYHQHHNGEDRLFCYDVPFDKLPLGEYIFWIERSKMNSVARMIVEPLIGVGYFCTIDIFFALFFFLLCIQSVCESDVKNRPGFQRNHHGESCSCLGIDFIFLKK
jgi:hypothetical protein